MPIFSTLFVSAVLAALISGFGVGFYVSHGMDKAEISKMRNDINAANTLAANTLKIETDKVAAATRQSINANINLDKSHEAYIKTVNAYAIKLDTYRLYAGSGKGCGSPSATGAGAGLPAHPACGPKDARDPDRVVKEFSERLERIINEQAKLSAIAYAYARDAYQFAFVNNCGIAR